MDSRRVGEEGEIVDPSSVVSLPVVDGRLDNPNKGVQDRSGDIGVVVQKIAHAFG